MHDPAEVAKVTEHYLRERADRERSNNDWGDEEKHQKFIAVLDSATASPQGDNQVVCRVVDNQHGVIWAYVAEDALDKAAFELAIDGEIIHNGPCEYLLAW